MGADRLGRLPLKDFSDVAPQSRKGTSYIGALCCDKARWALGFGKVIVACADHGPSLIISGMRIPITLDDIVEPKPPYTSTFEEDDPWMKT